MSQSMPTLCRILFIDIVGFSKKPSHDQKLLIEKLTWLVQQVPHIAVLKKEHRVELPTGDGIALALWGPPELPLNSALKLAQLIKTYNSSAPPSLRIEVRTGINSGEVFTMTDIKQNRNIVGEGINNTQRVMDFGNSGHILCSKKLAEEILAVSPAYAPLLHDAGLFADKHGLQHHVYNVFDWELGNSETPTRNRADCETIPRQHFWKNFVDLLLAEAGFLRHPCLEPAHLFLAFTKLEDSKTAAILRNANLDPTQTRRELRRLLGKGNCSTAPTFSDNLANILAQAWNKASVCGQDINESFLMDALLTSPAGQACHELLQKVGLDVEIFAGAFSAEAVDPFASCISSGINLANSPSSSISAASFISDPGFAPAANPAGFVTMPLGRNHSQGLKVSLLVENGAQQGKIFSFNEPELFIVGRSPQANFVLDHNDSCVSRRHFMIEIVPPRCYIKDFNSMNGTFVNQQRCTQAELHDGDRITAGQTSFLVRISANAADLPTCQRCGEFFRPPDSAAKAEPICPACRSEIELEAQNLFARTKVPVKAACDICGIDLSLFAGSDGLGLDLADVATYRCKDCVNKQILAGSPASFNRYLLLQQLGQGGMGTVYLAWNQDSCRIAALKRILLPKPDARAAQRFLREMRIMAQLNHPNLVRIFHDGIEESSPFFACEYLGGGCLSSLLAKQKKLLPEDALHLTNEVLTGLEYFHRSGHIHRDLKPSNILLNHRQTDSYQTAKIADFGLSRSYVNLGGTRLTRTGEFAGSLYYTPPEQIINFARVTPAADIYSVGATLYQMLTGALPYNFAPCRDEASFKDSLLTVLEDEIVPIRQRDGGIAPALAEIVETAINKDPSRRYSSAAAFKQAIAGFLEAGK